MNKTTIMVGVAGAGAMGVGIAQTAAMAGFRVILYGRRSGAFEGGWQAVRASLVKLYEKGKVFEEPETILSRITPSSDLESLSCCHLVVEAVAENLVVKSDLYKVLAPLLSENVILATTTSSLSVTALGAASGIPERFIGMHFMNPVPLMEVVELIVGTQTSPHTILFAREILAALGKKIVHCKDKPGFIITRLLGVMINEAFRMLEDGVASAEDIDIAMKLGAHHPMGPFALADLVGLDIIQSSLGTLSLDIDKDRYASAPLLQEHVAKGLLGKKSGQGVYSYFSKE